MSSNATTLIAPGGLSEQFRDAGGVRSRRRLRAQACAEAGLLLVIVLTSLLLVIVAADRPSSLVPPSYPHYFPHWMAGPLGGLLPGFTRNGPVMSDLMTYSIVGMYLAYLLALKWAPRLRPAWVIAAIVAVNLIFFLSPPLALTDVFNYINYGRMEIVHHLNPYATIPAVEPHSDPSYALSNWHHLLSPYGPLFTIFTFALVPLGVAGSFWVMKGVLVAFSLGIVCLVWHCARMFGTNPVRAIVFVGLNPVVMVWGLGGDHNDFIPVFFIMLALFLLLRRRIGRAPAPNVQAAHSGVHPLGADGRRPAPPLPVGATVAMSPVAAGGARDTLGFAAVPVDATVIAAAGFAQRTARRLRLATSRAMASARAAVSGPTARSGAALAAPPAATIPGAPSVAPAVAPPTAPPSASPAAPPALDDTQLDLESRPVPAVPARRTSRSEIFTPTWQRVRAWLWPPLPAELAAGAALVLAVAIKASAAILLPVVLLGLLSTPRRMTQVFLGMVTAAVGAGIATYVAFGAHIPDLSTQDKLITLESIPNLVGLGLGQGGETATLRLIVQLLLVASVVAASLWAWRRRDILTPAGWVTLALLLALSWVLPWYVLWLLPLAAISHSRALRGAALVFGAYLILVWAPLASNWYSAIGFNPSKTQVGQAHQRETKLLLH